MSASAATTGRLQRHLRLVVQHEFVPFQRTPQFPVDRQARDGLGVHALLEEQGLAAAGGLGAIHRGVGVLEQRVVGVAVVRE